MKINLTLPVVTSYNLTTMKKNINWMFFNGHSPNITLDNLKTDKIIAP